MRNAKKRSAASRATDVDAEVDAEIRRCESMTPRQVDKELRDLRIDPRPTIDAVMKLLRQKQAGRKRHA